MGRKSRMSVLKRQREAKKAQKQGLKREKRAERGEAEVEADRVATKDDLAGYGFPEEEAAEETPAD